MNSLEQENQYHDLIQQLFAMVAVPTPVQSPDLEPLFHQLSGDLDPGKVSDVEYRIWQIWCSHPDETASRMMKSVFDAFNSEDLITAESLLNEMVERWPDWSEAWNKRATLRFAQNRLLDSLSDIVQTLGLEPRHFGAFGGFGQICVRIGDFDSALRAFEQGLMVNPHMTGIREAVRMLRQQSGPTVH